MLYNNSMHANNLQHFIGFFFLNDTYSVDLFFGAHYENMPIQIYC